MGNMTHFEFTSFYYNSKHFFYIYKVFLTRGFGVPVNQGNFANKEKTTEISFTDGLVFSILISFCRDTGIN